MASNIPVAVILDFDGVVVNSLAAHLAAWRAATREVLHKELADEREFAAMATRTIAAIIAKRYGDASLAGVLTQSKWRLLTESTIPVPLYDGAGQFIDTVKAQHLPLGIASNSPTRFVQACLRQHGLTVATIVGGGDVARPKPRPDIYWECANRLKVLPRERERVLVFEDSLHGIKAALDAGMHAVGVATMHTPQVLRQAGALAVCHHLGDAAAMAMLTSFA